MFRQIGLGGNVVLDTITVPTEIVLWQSAADRVHAKCLSLSAGLFLKSRFYSRY